MVPTCLPAAEFEGGQEAEFFPIQTRQFSNLAAPDVCQQRAATQFVLWCIIPTARRRRARTPLDPERLQQIHFHYPVLQGRSPPRPRFLSPLWRSSSTCMVSAASTLADNIITADKRRSPYLPNPNPPPATSFFFASVGFKLKFQGRPTPESPPPH